MMDFVFQVMDFEFKMMKFVFKPGKCVFTTRVFFNVENDKICQEHLQRHVSETDELFI